MADMPPLRRIKTWPRCEGALCARPEDIAIVVAGGPEAYHLTYLPSFSSSDTVTVAI